MADDDSDHEYWDTYMANKVKKPAADIENSVDEEELVEGYYFCPHCNRKTLHELHPINPPHYETATDEQIAEAEANCTLFCISCADREEAAYREEVYGD